MYRYWGSFILHSAFVIGIFCVSAWNGANFYFAYITHRYEEKLKMLANYTPPRKKKVDEDSDE